MCTKNATVVIVDGENVIEKRVDLENMTTSGGWTECEVTLLFGIRLKYKRMYGPINHDTKEIARVLLVEPDRSLLIGPIHINNDTRSIFQRIFVSDAITSERKLFIWSNKAWTFLNHTKSLGPLMFARADKSNFSKDLFLDLVNYTYDMMEYYHNGKTFVAGIRKNQKYATQQEFQKYLRNLTPDLRAGHLEMNLDKYPECTSNQESYGSNEFFKNFQVFNL